ncbi:MAG TPA: GNAT family N-acetyltransferase [Rhodanobacteraceae bacterium]|nr:GNAT family N-acetyltransferase [Rhodanobacteraceae bacterium]
MRVQDLTSLRYSRAESARFGLRVFRAELDAVDAGVLVEALKRDRVDVAILRLPADAIASINELREYGFAPIVADTIVRYDIDLPAPRADLDEAVSLRDATPADAPLLESLAREIFAGYVTHYHANPLFPASKILDGYGEWAASHVSSERAGSAAWLVEMCGEIAGFSCYRLDTERAEAFGVLNGVLPSMRRQGVYRAMLRRMFRDFAVRGMGHFAIATQVQNVSVQRIWAAEGLSLRRTDNTVHINALFGRAQESFDDGSAASRAAHRAAGVHASEADGSK